jgi:glucose-6-phosphate 1-dehydrogenase
MILAVGGVLAALAYLGPIAIRAMPRWGACRAAADVEAKKAKVQAKLASEAARHVEQLTLEGRMSEAEQLAKEVEGYRQSESLHQRKSQEFLRRWW